MSAIVLLSAWNSELLGSMAAITIYWGSSWAARRLDHRALAARIGLTQARWRECFVFMRSLGLLLGVVAYLGHLYGNTPYLRQNSQGDTLWLLLLLPVVSVSTLNRTDLVLVMTSLASVMVTILATAVEGTNALVSPSLVHSLTRALWLGALALVIYGLSRLLAHHGANLTLTQRLLRKVGSLRDFQEDRELLGAIVSEIATEFGYEHVNIFVLLPSGEMRCLAASSDAGKSLIRDGVVTPSDRGIFQHVLRTGEPHLANDVTRCDYYYRLAALQDTGAEFVAPILVHGRIVGMLDIEDPVKQAFTAQDVEVLTITAEQVGMMLAHEALWRMDTIVHAITTQLLSTHDLLPTLETIADLARREHAADVVAVYARDPDTGELIGPVWSADAAPEHPARRFLPSPDGLLTKLLTAPSAEQFLEDIDQSETAWRPGTAPFARTWGITSRATLRMHTGTNCVGLMFLNFRAPRRFLQEEREAMLRFARLAALAITKAQYLERQVAGEIEDIVRAMHDTAAARAYFASGALDQVLGASATRNDPWLRERVAYARESVLAIHRQVGFVGHLPKRPPFNQLPGDLTDLAEAARLAAGIEVTLHTAGPLHAVPAMVVHDLLPILYEAVANALDANPQHLWISAEVRGEEMTAIVEDDGPGFDPRDVRAGGTTNMCQRAEKLGGTCIFEQRPQGGTRVAVWLPLPSFGRGAWTPSEVA